MKLLQQKSFSSKLQTFYRMICSRSAVKVCVTVLIVSYGRFSIRVVKLVQDCQHHAGPKDKLNSTAVSQPAIYVASLAALEKLKQDEGQVSCMYAVMHLDPYSTLCPTRCAIQGALDAADVACGLSLGEYTALTFAGAMR